MPGLFDDIHPIAQLLLQYHREGLSPQQEQQLQDWIGDSPSRRQLVEDLRNTDQLQRELEKIAAWPYTGVRAKIEAQFPDAFTTVERGEAEPTVPAPSGRTPLNRRPIRWLAAAAVFLALLTGAWWLYQRASRQQQTPIAQAPADIQPGTSKAILTLAGGRRILLDSAHIGPLATEGNARIRKTDSGTITVQANAHTKPATGIETTLNTLSTPRGGQYQLVLPDGSRVWLNAASSITYPTSFTGPNRNVTITGEAWLEVAANPRQPFVIHSGEQELTVLGTSFNLNAYTDEPDITTTLVDGRIRIRHQGKAIELKPGEQARAAAGSGLLQVVPHADIEAAIAWRKGLFAFTNANLPTVLRQLARWYDLDIQYPQGIPKTNFTGEIGRGLTLTQVLHGLGGSGVHFSLEPGHLLVVRP